VQTLRSRDALQLARQLHEHGLLQLQPGLHRLELQRVRCKLLLVLDVPLLFSEHNVLGPRQLQHYHWIL
jgi:hypothetical protein